MEVFKITVSDEIKLNFNLSFGKLGRLTNIKDRKRDTQLKKINDIFHLCPLGVYAIFNGEQRDAACVPDS